jgi:hypothetical protein
VRSNHKPNADQLAQLTATSLKILPSMPMSTVRLKIGKLLGIPGPKISSAELYLVHGGVILLLEKNQLSRTAEWFGVDSDSTLAVVLQ